MKNKIIYILMLMLLVDFRSNGQIVNGNFSTVTFTGGDCTLNIGPALSMATSPFVACNSPYGIDGWVASHGSPEIFNLFGTTNNVATMWSGRYFNNFLPTGEGIHTACYTFEEGKVYHLSLKMNCSSANTSGTPDIDNYISKTYIKLGNSVPVMSVVDYSPGSSNYAIPTVASTQTILELTNFNSTSPQTFDFYFTPDDDYVNLWIYPVHNNGTEHISFLFVDDVAIAGCVATQAYSSTSSLPAVTLRSNYITAGTSTQVLNTQNVTFTAGNYITLSPGFVANSGSVFLANIAQCGAAECTNPMRSSSTEEEQPTGIEEAQSDEEGFVIYPNPGNGYFTIHSKEAITNSTIEVYDIVGKLLYTKQVSRLETEQVDIADFKSGMYYFVIKGDNAVNIMCKVVKE